MNLQSFRYVTLLERDPNTGVCCHYCKSFKNTYFEEHLRTATPVYSNDLIVYLNCVTKNMPQGGSEFIKKKVICKEKPGAVKKVN